MMNKYYIQHGFFGNLLNTIGCAAIMILLIISCEERRSGITDDPFYIVDIVVVDSVSGLGLDSVRVVEMKETTTLNQIILSDSTLSFYPDYYVIGSYTDHKGAIEWLWRDSDQHIPNYSQYVAFKHGYKIWQWADGFHTIHQVYKNDDSLFIRMVKK
jgi:hypothetical protein